MSAVRRTLIRTMPEAREEAVAALSLGRVQALESRGLVAVDTAFLAACSRLTLSTHVLVRVGGEWLVGDRSDYKVTGFVDTPLFAGTLDECLAWARGRGAVPAEAVARCAACDTPIPCGSYFVGCTLDGKGQQQTGGGA